MPSAWVKRRTSGYMGQSNLVSRNSRLPSSNVHPAPTLPHQPYLVLYLVSEHFLRYHENHCPYWLRRGYLVLYLTGLPPPESLVIWMVPAALLHVHVPTLEIIRIRFHPLPLALLLRFALHFASLQLFWVFLTLGSGL